LLLVLRPVGLAPDFEPETLSVSKPVLVFQVLADENFESGVFAPLDRVRCVADEGAEITAVFGVAPEARFAVGFARLLQREERLPRLAVLPLDLLYGRRAENTTVAPSVLADLPDVTVRVGVVFAALTRPAVSFAHKIATRFWDARS
jgi:hypothetical protein